MNQLTKVMKKTQMRDAHIFEVLTKDALLSMLDLNSGVIFPDPNNPSALFREDFWCTQILIVGTADFYWKLDTNRTALGVKTPESRTISGGYIATTTQSLPLTVNLWFREGTQAIMRTDSDLGAIAPGNWKIFLIGYYESIKPEDVGHPRSAKSWGS